MKVCVDTGSCRLHGQCVIAAPNVFSFAADGTLNWMEHPDPSLRQAVEGAADACPEQAITIED